MDHFSFMPHAVCYLWRSDLITMHLLGDTIIALSYFAIPLLIWRIIPMVVA